MIKFRWWYHESKLLHQKFISELLLNVAEDNHFCVFFFLAFWVFSFIYFIDFGYFVIFSSEEQSYLFIFILIAHDSFFCLSYFTLTTYKDLQLILLLVSTRVTFNEQFSRWRYFPFYGFGKRKFGEFTNGILAIRGPARFLPPPPPKKSSLK